MLHDQAAVFVLVQLIHRRYALRLAGARERIRYVSQVRVTLYAYNLQLFANNARDKHRRLPPRELPVSVEALR